jgi:hypothetical protein
MRARIFAAAGLVACTGLFGCNQNQTAVPPGLRPQTCDCAPRALAPPPAPVAATEPPLPERYEDEESRRTVRRHHHARYAMRGSYTEYGEHPWSTGYAGGEVATYNYVSPSQHYYAGEGEGYRSAGYESESAGGAYDNGAEQYEDSDEGPPDDRDYPQQPMSINSSGALDSWNGYSDNGIYDHGYGGGDLAESVISSAAGVVEAGAESGLIDLGVDILASRWGGRWHGGHRWWNHGHGWGHKGWGDHDHDWDDHRHGWGRKGWGDHDHDWDDHRHRWGDHDHDWDDHRHRWGDHDHDWDDHRGWGHGKSWPSTHRSWSPSHHAW